MDNFRKLTIWKRSVELATVVYKKTSCFPKHEVYGLRSQIRRSVVSISSNIAEGSGRNSKRDFVKFLRYSYSSACELETQLLISKNLGYLTTEESKRILTELNEIQKMTFVLQRNKSN